MAYRAIAILCCHAQSRPAISRRRRCADASTYAASATFQEQAGLAPLFSQPVAADAYSRGQYFGAGFEPDVTSYYGAYAYILASAAASGSESSYESTLELILTS